MTSFCADRVICGAYELSLGCEIGISSSKREATQFWHLKQKPVIPAGQFGVLVTQERITVPVDSIAFISVKHTFKKQGLVNVSGFHADPGFSGQLHFSVFNAGIHDVILEVGKPTFQIWFATFDESVEEYTGKHRDQCGLSPSDVACLRGRMPSLPELDRRVVNLEWSNKIIWAIAVGLIVAFVLNGLDLISKREKSPAVAPVSQRYDNSNAIDASQR